MAAWLDGVVGGWKEGRVDVLDEGFFASHAEAASSCGCGSGASREGVSEHHIFGCGEWWYGWDVRGCLRGGVMLKCW